MPNEKEIREEFFTLIEDMPLPVGVGVEIDVERGVVLVTLGPEIAESKMSRERWFTHEHPHKRMAGMLLALGSALNEILDLVDSEPDSELMRWEVGGLTLTVGDRVKLIGPSWPDSWRGRYGEIRYGWPSPVVVVGGVGRVLEGDFSTRVRKADDETWDKRMHLGDVVAQELVTPTPLDEMTNEELCEYVDKHAVHRADRTDKLDPAWHKDVGAPWAAVLADEIRRDEALRHYGEAPQSPLVVNSSSIRKDGSIGMVTMHMHVDLTKPCDECKGTGFYTGLDKVEPCSKGCVAS